MPGRFVESREFIDGRDAYKPILGGRSKDPRKETMVIGSIVAIEVGVLGRRWMVNGHGSEVHRWIEGCFSRLGITIPAEETHSNLPETEVVDRDLAAINLEELRVDQLPPNSVSIYHG